MTLGQREIKYRSEVSDRDDKLTRLQSEVRVLEERLNNITAQVRCTAKYRPSLGSRSALS